MLTQYLYALGSMLPCPVWFYYRWPSAAFLFSMFSWSIYNGATYYIDVFGTRFQKELEQMKKDVAKWQTSPETMNSPLLTPKAEGGAATPQVRDDSQAANGHRRGESSVDDIPLLDTQTGGSTTTESAVSESTRERK